jgi:hypothetical protein
MKMSCSDFAPHPPAPRCLSLGSASSRPSSCSSASCPSASLRVRPGSNRRRPHFYLDEGWPAPMLQQMARDGAYYLEYDSIQVKTICPAAARRGLTTANVGWPATL